MITVSLLIVLLIIVVEAAIFTHLNLNRKYDLLEMQLDEVINSPHEPLPVDIMDYSSKLLEYFREFTIQVTALRFQGFRDNHDMDKTTAAILKSFIHDTSMEIHKSISEEKIDFNHTLFTKEFLEQYIINIVINTTKTLFDKSIEGVE